MQTFTRNENVLTVEENLENFIDKCTKDAATKVLFLRCAVNCPWHLSSLYFAKSEPIETFSLPYDADLAYCVIATRDPYLGTIDATCDAALDTEEIVENDTIPLYEQKSYSTPAPQF